MNKLPKILLFFLLAFFFGCKNHETHKVLKLAHGLDPSHPVHKGMVFMAERLAEKSKGQLTIDIYPSGQLGSEQQCVELLQIGSLAITKVSAAVMESFTLNITFPTNSDVITAQYQPEVQKVADFLTKHADVTVVIEGHTDSQGAEAYNQKLSQRRADSVRSSLINKYGIAGDRIESVGYGEAKPIASNDTADGRAKNRRVVAVMEKEVLQ